MNRAQFEFLVTIFLILFSNKLIAQNQNVYAENEIVNLINRVDEKYGNVYILDHYDTVVLTSTSKNVNRNLEQAYMFVTQTKVPWCSIDYGKIKSRFLPKQLLTKVTFQRDVDKAIVLTSEEKEYAAKIDEVAQKHADAILIEPPFSDSINTLFNLVGASLNTKLLYDRLNKTKKKLFRLTSVYASSKFILIIYGLNFGDLEDEIFVELILR